MHFAWTEGVGMKFGLCRVITGREEAYKKKKKKQKQNKFYFPQKEEANYLR